MEMSKVKRGEWVLVLLLAVVFLAGGFGCDGAGGGARSGVQQLDPGEDKLGGGGAGGGDVPAVYEGFHKAGEMIYPRYEHEGITLDDGTVLVVGGSDERLFTSVDVCEIFNQSLAVEPEPETKTGGWISTDFEGNEMRLQGGGRIFHTLSPLSEGRVLICGGAPDATTAEAYEHPEIFDPHTRSTVELTGSMEVPRFCHTAESLTRGQVIFLGGQLGKSVTVVNPEYPPWDPRFIQELDTFPGTEVVEEFNSSLDSDDSLGNFAKLKDNDGYAVTLPEEWGRSNHGSGRIAGYDDAVGNVGDMFVLAGGYKTMSAMFAPQTKLPRQLQGDTSMLETIDIYDGFNEACFTAPGISLEVPRAYEVICENVGWRQDVTYDGYKGLSNVFIVTSGSDNSLPTTGAWPTEGFAATFTGFGPGGGLSLLRAEIDVDDDIPTAVETVLGETVDQDALGVYTPGGCPPEEIPSILCAISESRWIAAAGGTPIVGPTDARRVGKFFSGEAAFAPNTQDAFINRVNTESVRVLRKVYTPFGQQNLGNIFIGAGGYFVSTPAGQFQWYDEVPVSSAEYFDPNFNVINALILSDREPYNLNTVRMYWASKRNVDLPDPDNPGAHPHPSGCNGAWLIVDGFLPSHGWEGYQIVPPNTQSEQDLRIRHMEKGRAWHTMDTLPGLDGHLGTPDDRVLFAGGGEGVLRWGGEPVIPSTVVFVPPPPR